MVDHHRREVGHAKRVALHIGLVDELGGHHHRDRFAQRLKGDAVMRTARRTRPSIADGGQDDVVVGGDGRDKRRVGDLGEAFLLVIADGGDAVPGLQ